MYGICTKYQQCVSAKSDVVKCRLQQWLSRCSFSQPCLYRYGCRP